MQSKRVAASELKQFVVEERGVPEMANDDAAREPNRLRAWKKHGITSTVAAFRPARSRESSQLGAGALAATLKGD